MLGENYENAMSLGGGGWLPTRRRLRLIWIYRAAALWWPDTDPTVLLAAIALAGDVLVTSYATRFGAGYGKRFKVVIVRRANERNLSYWI